MAQRPDPADETPARAQAPIDPAAVARWRRQLDGQAGERPAEAWLHGEIARRMAERLPLIRRQPGTVIDWWSGASASQALLRQHYPKAQLIPVDCSGQVRAEAGRADRWWRKWASQTPTPDAQPPSPAGLLWSNMMLHWVDDLPSLLARWHRLTVVDGFLMFSCFGPDTLRELHALYQRAGHGPPATRPVDMHDIGDALVHAGFADPVMDMEQLTLTWDNAQALLDELRSLGRNTHRQRHPGLRTPRWHAALVDQLERELIGPDGRLHLSFEIVYGHAFRPPAKARISAQTEISLDAMREMTRQRNREDPA